MAPYLHDKVSSTIYALYVHVIIMTNLQLKKIIIEYFLWIIYFQIIMDSNNLYMKIILVYNIFNDWSTGPRQNLAETQNYFCTTFHPVFTYSVECINQISGDE